MSQQALGCAVPVETIEHLDPARLSKPAHALFRQMSPQTVVITTPNAEFNPLLGVPRTGCGTPATGSSRTVRSFGSGARVRWTVPGIASNSTISQATTPVWEGSARWPILTRTIR
ncbi:hypothetical protein E4L95_03885 [Paracoccus liaowanqingii]|uniref:Small RNA 2'-O-methyltransferase n=1 Tax=Paracoccus liaowanqingii TaxID=2560053 RepID=A0A4Z1CRE4_9RHOB|nr:hypothetical protein [Paracoccus liaowanqingii]TGN67760.1 hypothetical protein E4L95_03885 [Paracoccus liaowanqingii]